MIVSKPLPRKVQYTHVVTWKEKRKDGSCVFRSFPTDKPSANWHIRQMQMSEMCYDIEVKPYAGTKV